MEDNNQAEATDHQGEATDHQEGQDQNQVCQALQNNQVLDLGVTSVGSSDSTQP